jgi:PKD repeat protein
MKGKNGKVVKIYSFVIIVIILTIFSIPIHVAQADNQIIVSFLPIRLNHPPVIHDNEHPKNNSTNVGLQVKCHITVSDEDDDPLTIYWCENSSGTWMVMQTDSAKNGTYHWTYSEATDYSTTYYWRVYVFDGNETVSATYCFTTEPEEYIPPIPPQPPTPNLPPIAKITGPNSSYADENVIFYANESYDPDGNITAYRWDFDGDGVFDTDWIEDTFIEYSYSIPGNYTVRLRVVDDRGAINMTTHFIQITELEPPLELPIPQINGPYYGYVDEDIAFDSTGTYDPDGIIIQYIWHFGDNRTSYLENPIHSYDKAGNYTAVLIVKDNDNLTNLTTTKVTIIDRETKKPEEKILPFPSISLLIIAILITIAILIASILKRRKKDDSDNDEEELDPKMYDLVVELKVDEILSKSDKKDEDDKEL